MSMISYHENAPIRGLNAGGAYGTIPESELLRKIEVVPTSYQEDSESVENHMRNLLKDFRPDQPFLASDEPRRAEDRGGGNHSESFLNLRHGGAFGALDDPYLPDGTFLELTERDPRGIATGPDMRKHYEQQMSRAAFIKFYNDADYSTTEIGINPTQMVKNIKSGFYPFKDRYQNFEESFDSWTNPYQGITRSGSDVGNVTMDGTVMDLTDSSVKNRRDAVSQLSNDPTVAFRYATTDHRFKIARYGMVRVNQDKSYQNWDNTKRSTYLDHANMAVIDGVRVNKMLARLIIDLEGIRDTKQKVAQGAAYGDSAVNQQAKRKMAQDDIYKLIRIEGFNTHAKSAHEEFDGKQVHKYGNKPMNNQRKLAEAVQVNHEITISMERATKRQQALNKEGFVNLRENIEQTAAERGIYKEASNRRMTEQMRSANMTRNVLDTRHVEDQKEIKNYAGIAPAKHRKTHENTDWETYGAHSQNTINRKGKRDGAANKTTDDHEQDQDNGRLDFGVYDKASKSDHRDHMGRPIQYNMEFGDVARLDEVGEVDIQMFGLKN
jgi:hypothetical protein